MPRAPGTRVPTAELSGADPARAGVRAHRRGAVDVLAARRSAEISNRGRMERILKISGGATDAFISRLSVETFRAFQRSALSTQSHAALSRFSRQRRTPAVTPRQLTVRTRYSPSRCTPNTARHITSETRPGAAPDTPRRHISHQLITSDVSHLPCCASLGMFVRGQLPRTPGPRTTHPGARAGAPAWRPVALLFRQGESPAPSVRARGGALSPIAPK